jgi:hypothetical protein
MTDFESDLESRLESGMDWETVVSELGSPKKAASDLNEQMREYVYRKSPWRHLFGIAAVLSGGWLMAYGLLKQFGLPLYTLQWILSPSEAASIGIIGGADGPTAIFVTSTAAGPDWDLILVSAIALLSFLAFLRLRKCKPNE